MAGASTEEMVREVEPDAVPAEAPPESANYRDPDVQGIACAFCVHFRYEGSEQAGDDPNAIIPTGTCGLYEAKVRGDKVSDGFKDADPTTLDEDGKEQYDFSDSVQAEFFVGHENAIELSQEDNLVYKEILRTGEWAITPTAAGPVKRPMKIIGDGESDLNKGIIAMSDIEKAFAENVIPHVTVPLTDEEKRDHKDIARVNTGFVKKLRRIKKADGDERLVAGIHFTEPDAQEKVLRGTYADTSAGVIPFLDKKTGKVWPAVLKHTVITNSPWIDGMGPWGAQFSDDQAPTTVVSYQPADEVIEWDDRASFEWRKTEAQKQLQAQLGLSGDYVVTNIADNKAIVKNDIAETSWIVPYEVTSDSVSLSAVAEWAIKDEGQKEPVEPEVVVPPPSETKKDAEPAPPLNRLQAAQRMRAIRLSQTETPEGGSTMSGTTDNVNLDGLELSDDARASIQSVLDENARLRATTRESGANTRIEELKGMGFSEAPGFLKLYRQVFLSDDGQPAAILLSQDSGVERKEEISALALLDRTIEALPKKDGKLMFSDQHVTNGNDDPPPAEPEKDGDERPLDERLAEAQAAIGEKPVPAGASA